MTARKEPETSTKNLDSQYHLLQPVSAKADALFALGLPGVQKYLEKQKLESKIP
jgi:hypothetical protein